MEKINFTKVLYIEKRKLQTSSENLLTELETLYYVKWSNISRVFSILVHTPGTTDPDTIDMVAEAVQAYIDKIVTNKVRNIHSVCPGYHRIDILTWTKL